MSSARLTRRGRTRVRMRPAVSPGNDSPQFNAGNNQRSPPPHLDISLQPSLPPIKDHSRRRNLKEKYSIDDLEMKNTLGWSCDLVVCLFGRCLNEIVMLISVCNTSLS